MYKRGAMCCMVCASYFSQPLRQGMDKAGVVLILRDRPRRRVHNQRPENRVAHRPVATLIGKTTRRSLLYSTVITFATIVFAAITARTVRRPRLLTEVSHLNPRVYMSPLVFVLVDTREVDSFV